MKRLIFTDLDGTFLNHDDYSFVPSLDALDRIKQQNIPLIFTTSKTKSEVIELQKKVGIIEPFIIENGAALFIPKEYSKLNMEELEEYDGYKVVIFGKHYDEILAFYTQYKNRFGMKGFSDMSIAEISALTGLDEGHSLLAKQRDFTEPFILEDSTHLVALSKAADDYGLKITRGGRFYHLIGKYQDKGVAVEETIKLFEKLFDEPIESFGFGDSENDILMFENVDKPIIIQKLNGSYVPCDIENIQHSTYPGSNGFNEMVLKNVT